MYALLSCYHLFYVNFKFKAIFINIYAVIYFVKLYHAGTVCARRRARLLVMFRSGRGLETGCQVTLN